MWFTHCKKIIYAGSLLAITVITFVLIAPQVSALGPKYSLIGDVLVATTKAVDGVTTYGPVTVVLTDTIPTSTPDEPVVIPTSTMTPAKADAVSNTTTAFVKLHYQFDNLKSGDTYQVCIKDTQSCSPERKIGDPTYINATIDGVSTTTANIEVTAADQAANSNLIPIKSTSAVTTSSKTCGDVVTGVGWILCPVVTGITALNDSMWSLVSGLLNVNPINQSSSIYAAWSAIRNIANVVFVIIFLVMIFSQVSNIGITNYGIKKLLPRLIIGAILVNVSFVIVQIIVDLANIIGSSLYNLLAGLAPNDFLAKAWTGLPGMILSAVGGTGLLVGGVALIGGAAAAFWMLAPVALMGLLALLAAILTLIFRQAVIPILAILAPLAFVAYLLPNTESWFKKWRSMLMQMLMLYPLAAVVFGGSQLAARLIIGESPDWWNTVMGVIIMTLPLFSLPYLATKGGAIVSTVGGALNGIVNKAKAPISKTAGAYADRARVQTDNQALNRIGGFSPRRSYLQYRARTEAIGQNQQRELTRGQASYVANRAESNTAFRTALAAGGGQGADMRALASAVNVISDLGGKEITAARAVIDHMNLSGDEKNQLARGILVTKNGQKLDGSDANVREAAIMSAVSTNTIEEIEKIIRSSDTMNDSQRHTLVTSMISSGIPNKAIHLGGKTLNEIEQNNLNKILDSNNNVIGGRTTEQGLDDATKRAITEGKYSAEKIAANDPISLKRIANVMKELSTSTNTTDINAANNLRKQFETAITDSRISGTLTAIQKSIIESNKEFLLPTNTPPANPPSGFVDQFGRPL